MSMKLVNRILRNDGITPYSSTCYDGTQLRHAYAYEMSGVLGDTLTAFIGGADVKDHMVDLEDVKANDFISSELMVHYIIEIFNASLRETVLCQRLFIQHLAKSMADSAAKVSSSSISTRGDDIFLEQDNIMKKMSVSIATLSPFSGLIHVGINIIPGAKCPVKAAGLVDIRNTGHDEWAIVQAQNFVREFNDITDATYKVKGV